MSGLPGLVLDGVIDVSHHNGRIDWARAAAAGIALAFVKASEGARFVDPAFAEKFLGFIVGEVIQHHQRIANDAAGSSSEGRA